MQVTDFGIIFIPLCAVCTFHPVRLLQLTLIAGSFESAAAVTFGDYGVGSSIISAAAFFSLLASQALIGHTKFGVTATWRTTSPFVAVTTWGVIGSVLLPRVFAGQVEVWPQKADPLVGLVLLAPSAGNLTQDLYLILACLMLCLSAGFFTRLKSNSYLVFRTYLYTGFLASGFAFWQLANHLTGFPFPEQFLRSNPGWAILTQSIGNVPRISGAFSEPASLAGYMSGILGATTFMILKGHQGSGLRVLAVLAFATIAISTSTTGYVVILLTVIGLPLYAIKSNTVGLITRIVKIGIVMIICIALSTFFLLTVKPALGSLLLEVLGSAINKTDSSSFDQRSGADLNSLSLLFSTFGLGVGWGSNRSSSLLPGTLASLGLLGTSLFMLFAARVARLAIRGRSLVIRSEDAAVIDGTTGAILGGLVAALIAGPTYIGLTTEILLGIIIGTSTRVILQNKIIRSARRQGDDVMSS